MEKLITGLILGYLFLFPFGQLTRLPLSFTPSPEVRIYLIDIFVFLILVCWGGWRFLLIKRKYQLPLLAKPIFLFSLVAALSLIINSPLFAGREIMVAGLYLLRWLTYAGLYFVISDLKGQFNWLNWKNFQKILIGIGSSVAVFGLLQYIFWPDISDFQIYGWDPHYYRLVGTFLDPGFTGIILVLTLIALLVQKKFLLAYYFLFGIIYLALALTYSRASYLAFLVGAAVIAVAKKSAKFFLAVLLIMILTIVVLPKPEGEGVKLERTVSAQARIGNWQQVLIIARDHPFLGVGFNAYRYAQKKYGFLGEGWQTSHAGAGADSSLLFVLATTGIVGLVAYLWLWLSIFKKGGVYIFASIIALLIHSFFNNSLFYPWVMGWLWLILALP